MEDFENELDALILRYIDRLLPDEMISALELKMYSLQDDANQRLSD